MTPRNDLHQLIQSMSASERRYFRMYAQMQESKQQWNYIRLFDALLAQDEYDEAAIKTQFRGERIEQNLAVEKHYLYMMLLRILRQYHTRKRKEWELRELIEGVFLLAERELTEPAWNLLKRARRAAEKLGQPLLELQVHLLERRLMKRRSSKNMAQDMLALAQKGESLVEKVDREIQMHNLYDRYSLELGKNYVGQGQELSPVFEEILSHALIKDIPEGEHFQVQVLRLQILAGIAYQQRDLKQAHVHFKAIRRLWEANPAQIRSYPLRFLKVLANLMVIILDLDLDEDFLPVLRRSQQVRERFNLDDTSGKFRELQQEMMFYGNRGELDLARVTADALASLWAAHPRAMSQNWRLPTAFNLCSIYFVNGAFSKSLQWAEELLAIATKDKRKRLQRVVQILILVIHFQLNHFDLLDYQLRNTHLRMRKGDVYRKFELIMIKALKKMLGNLQPEPLQIELGALQQTLQVEFSQSIPGLLEVQLWIQSRLQKRSIRTLAARELQAIKKMAST